MIRCFYAVLLFSLANAAAAAEIHRVPGKDGAKDSIFLTGVIQPGDEKVFKTVALETDAAVVVLDSPGGSLVIGTEIGKIIRLKGFSTSVLDAKCTSACALAWLAGDPRMMTASSQIGFHEASEQDADGNAKSSGFGNALIGAYVRSLGLNDNVLELVTAAEPNEMAWLTRAKARELGLAVFSVDDQHHARATFNKAVALQWKDQPDPAEAFKLYRRSAEDGYAGAQNNLGDLYELGKGVSKSDKQAVYWYTRSAERGEPTAYLSLCTILADSEDEGGLIEALKFALLAMDKLPDGMNKATATKTAEKLKAVLPQAAQDRAKALADAWEPLYQEKYLMSDTPAAKKLGASAQ